MSETWLFSSVLLLHIGAGASALISLTVPFVSRKGGRIHRRSGWVFTASMGVIAVTAWALCAFRLIDGDPSNDGRALFLGYVGVLSGASVWMGIRSVRMKRDRQPNRRPYDLLWPLSLVGGAVPLVARGAERGEPLLFFFAALGLFNAIPQLKYWLRPRPAGNPWLLLHLSSMGAGAIAAVTAFLVVNVGHWGLERIALLFWIAPSVLGGLLITMLTRKHSPAARQPATRS